VVFIQVNFGVRLINFGKINFTGIACIVEKLMLVAPKMCQFPQNIQTSLICFVSVLTGFQFSNIFKVSYRVGDGPSDHITGNFLNIFFICQGNSRARNFAHRKDILRNIATNVSCLAKERCIPATARLETNISQ
jgi:hypothetical protein